MRQDFQFAAAARFDLRSNTTAFPPIKLHPNAASWRHTLKILRKNRMSANSARLLLVDDDPTIIRIMSQMLATYPDQQFATSGEAAIELAKESPPDLILLDADMPGMTGFDVCEVLKADASLAHVPIIFVTSHDAPALEVDALRLGASDYVTKPLVAAQLAARVRAQLRVRQIVKDIDRDCRAGKLRTWPATPARPNLLIIEDELSTIQLMRRTLENTGILHFAGVREEAFRLAHSYAPTLIILNTHTAQNDGFEICATLKAEAALEHVPIVYIAPAADVDTEQRALDLGAADVITQPFKPAVLQARIQRIINTVRRIEAEARTIIEYWQTVDPDSRETTVS
jgi:two-component system, cell cycle response regulator